jgi:hypothetical protein
MEIELTIEQIQEAFNYYVGGIENGLADGNYTEYEADELLSVEIIASGAFAELEGILSRGNVTPQFDNETREQLDKIFMSIARKAGYKGL